ncbi:SH3 domain-binding glutamic acid-rich-like protein 3 [Lytechinus variegatus]|uniref:SH3 domain-binding glutamic acid-rich-like protein 3 n=1 Tax=Lytechinus variegatus TaxID=7654 RepID=UPI001BB1CCF0|nr:SH3 domain-binding glutamic acid-rich-like protein 3 [Lytechinus variegatus]XP_041462216.1 SH3 domain-binding glutamic acid-rich-like protein 3 [Lytechinus variegatus]
MSKITYYYTSVSSNLEIKKHQQKIDMILSSKKIDFDKVDISTDAEAKNKMRELAGDPKALPPQLCNGDTYLGDFSAFDAAVEAEEIEEFLKLK